MLGMYWTSSSLSIDSFDYATFAKASASMLSPSEDFSITPIPLAYSVDEPST